MLWYLSISTISPPSLSLSLIGYDIDSVLCTTARNKALDNGVSHLGINTYNLTLYIVIITTIIS